MPSVPWGGPPPGALYSPPARVCLGMQSWLDPHPTPLASLMPLCCRSGPCASVWCRSPSQYSACVTQILDLQPPALFPQSKDSLALTLSCCRHGSHLRAFTFAASGWLTVMVCPLEPRTGAAEVRWGGVCLRWGGGGAVHAARGRADWPTHYACVLACGHALWQETDALRPVLCGTLCGVGAEASTGDINSCSSVQSVAQ
jgi:hypothetical protein